MASEHGAAAVAVATARGGTSAVDEAAISHEMRIYLAAEAGNIDRVKQLVSESSSLRNLALTMAIMGGSECQDKPARAKICQWALEEGACYLFYFGSKSTPTIKGAMKPGNCKMLGGAGEVAKGMHKMLS